MPVPAVVGENNSNNDILNTILGIGIKTTPLIADAVTVATEGSLDASNASQVIASGSVTRKQVLIFNNTTEDVFLSRTGTATLDGIPIAPGESFIESVHTGPISGISSATATGKIIFSIIE